MREKIEVDVRPVAASCIAVNTDASSKDISYGQSYGALVSAISMYLEHQERKCSREGILGKYIPCISLFEGVDILMFNYLVFIF